jgi:hypothetical protein
LAATYDCSFSATLDAPGAFDIAACSSFCSYSGTTYMWVCDAKNFCGNLATSFSTATVVSNYNGTGDDYSAWIECNNTGIKACCAHHEDPLYPVDTVELIGTDASDTLNFTDPLGHLAPARAHDLAGYIYAGDDTCDPGDALNGSGHAGGDYVEHLYGEDGCDTIHGNAGGDWIDGGAGEDLCYGDDGADHITGGPDPDTMDGGNDNDTLCDDTTGITGAPLDLMLGGADNSNDRLWYWHPSGVAFNLDPASDAGGGMSDECGDFNLYGPTPWANCNVDIGTKPTTCP